MLWKRDIAVRHQHILCTSVLLSNKNIIDLRQIESRYTLHVVRSYVNMPYIKNLSGVSFLSAELVFFNY